MKHQKEEELSFIGHFIAYFVHIAYESKYQKMILIISHAIYIYIYMYVYMYICIYIYVIYIYVF